MFHLCYLWLKPFSLLLLQRGQVLDDINQLLLIEQLRDVGGHDGDPLLDQGLVEVGLLDRLLDRLGVPQRHGVVGRADHDAVEDRAVFRDC